MLTPLTAVCSSDDKKEKIKEKLKFPLTIQNNHFTPFFNACHQVQFEKKLLHRFRK